MRVAGAALALASVFLPWYVGGRSWSGGAIVGISVRELSRLAQGNLRTHDPNDPLWGASGVIVVLGPAALALAVLTLGLLPRFGGEAARASAWTAITLFMPPLLITGSIAESDGLDGPFGRWAFLGVLLWISALAARRLVQWREPSPAACLTAAALLGMCLPLVGFPMWSYTWGGGGVVDPGGIVCAIGMAFVAGGAAWRSAEASTR